MKKLVHPLVALPNPYGGPTQYGRPVERLLKCAEHGFQEVVGYKPTKLKCGHCPVREDIN